MAENNEPNEEPNEEPLAPGGRLDVDRLIAENGDAKAALRVLALKVNEVERRDARYRERLREWDERVPEGAVVLKGDDLDAYNKLKAFGAPDEIQAKLDKAAEDAQYRAQLEREAEFAKVAAAAGVSLAALQSAKGSDAVEYEIETTKGEDGEDTPVVYVKEGEGERVAFSDYVDTHWAPLKSALYATEEAEQRGAPAPVQRPAVRFVTQTPGGRPPAPKPPDAEQIARQKRGSIEYAGMI